MPVDEFQLHVENLGLQKLFESVQPIPDITKYHYIDFENKNVVLKYYSSQQANQPITTNYASPIEVNDNSKLSVDKIVAVHIKSEKQKGAIDIYMAEITNIDKKDVCLKYMVRDGNKYVWPNKTELSWQPIEDILVILSEPKLVNNRAQFTFQSDNLEKANLKARSLPGVKNINFK